MGQLKTIAGRNALDFLLDFSFKNYRPPASGCVFARFCGLSAGEYKDVRVDNF
jgi:hypothetical protein